MKKHIRKEVLALRNCLSKKEIKAHSKKIISQLLKTEEFISSQNIFVFISFGSEVETHEFIKHYINTKNIYVPFCSPKDGLMYPILLKEFNNLNANKFGVLEPTVSPDFILDEILPEFDLVLVPGVAFDKSHNRIGYGKGYYDNFFHKYKVKNKIALSFSIQICEKPFETENHDVPVDKILTEKGFF